MSHVVLRPLAKELEDLGGEAEIAWFAHLGEEKAEGSHYRSLHLPQGGQQKGKC